MALLQNKQKLIVTDELWLANVLLKVSKGGEQRTARRKRFSGFLPHRMNSSSDIENQGANSTHSFQGVTTGWSYIFTASQTRASVRSVAEILEDIANRLLMLQKYGKALNATDTTGYGETLLEQSKRN